MKRKIALLYCPGIISLFAVISCASTTLTQVWKDENYHGGYFKKILVIGVSANPEIRRFYEDEFVMQLKTRGADAIPSHTIIPSDKVLHKDTVVSKSKVLGVDSVLITQLLEKEKAVSYSPMRSYSDLSGYSSTVRRTVVQGKIFSLETNLFEIKTEKLIWSTRSDTLIDFGSTGDKEIKTLVTVIITNLSDEKLLQ